MCGYTGLISVSIIMSVINDQTTFTSELVSLHLSLKLGTFTGKHGTQNQINVALIIIHLFSFF